VSGDNGTIDGQGALWWEKFHKGELKYTRPYLIEIMYSENVQISSLTLVNSPSWNIHPVYSRFSSLSFNLHLAFHLILFCI
jgi:polygalacturonase